MLQRIFSRIHRCPATLFEIAVEGGIHAAEQGHGHGGVAELAILDGVHQRGHPAAADECLVRLGLIMSGTLHRSLIQPDIRDVEPKEHASRSGMPTESEQDGLASERFLPAGGPDALGDQVCEPKAFAAAPDAGGVIEGHCLFATLAISAFLRFEAGNDRALCYLELQFLQLPDFALTQAEAGLVLDEDGVVLGGLGGVSVRDDRDGGDLRVRREKGPDVQDSAERDIPEIRRRAVIADHAVGKHGERVRGISEKLARRLHTEAATAVRMVHEREHSPVGVRLFQSVKLPRLGPERLFRKRCGRCAQRDDEAQYKTIF